MIVNYGAVYIHVRTMRATIRGLVALIVVTLWNVRCATKLSLMALRHVGPCVGVIPTSFSEFSLSLLESLPPPCGCWIPSEYLTVNNLQMWNTFALFFTSSRLRYTVSFEGSSSRIFSTIFLYLVNLSMTTASFLL